MMKKDLGITSLDDAKKYAAELHAKTWDNIYRSGGAISAKPRATIAIWRRACLERRPTGWATNQSVSAALNAPAPSTRRIGLKYKA